MNTITEKRKHLYVFIIFIFQFFSLVNYSHAQKDTLFWFAAPNASSGLGDAPVAIHLTAYSNPATVTLSIPANVGFTPITVSVPANTHQQVDLSSFLTSIESPAGNVVSNNGIKIVSSALISASYSINSTNNKELFSLKGVNGLGTNFYTPFQKYWANSTSTPASFSSIDIVATQDNTTVLVTPRTAITGHAANTSFSVVLNAGQTYSARDVNTTAATSLAGSIVSSNKPVAVTIFEDGLANASCSDAIGEQLTNINQLGTKHIVRKGTGSTDRIYVLATQNGTNLTVHTSTTTSTTISWSETYEIALTDDIAYIESNKPVYVYHVSSMGCELGSSQVPNVFCAGDYITSAYRSSADDFGVIVYTRTGYEGLFTVNGTAGIINAGDFTNVPGTGGAFKVAQKFFSVSEVPSGSLAIIENSGDIFGLAVMQGNSSNGYSYAFLSDYVSKPYVDAGINDTVCANVGFPLNGIVGGGTLTGTWSSTGYGSFAYGLNNLTNEYIPSHLDVLINPVKIILTSDASCPSKKDTLYLTVNQQPLVNASADQTVCANNSLTSLNGTIQGGASTGIWSSAGGGVFAPGASTLNATYTPSSAETAAGNATLVLTSTNNGNCLAETDTMHINITPPPVVSISMDTIIVCANNNVVSLNGSVTGASTTGVWNSTGDGMFSPNNISLSTTYYPGLNDIAAENNWIYLRSTSNGNCLQERDSVYIVYTDAPVINAGNNDLVCSNDALITLNGSISGGATTGIWSGGAGIFSPSNTSMNATYTPTTSEISSGQVVLTLTSTNNGSCVAVNDVVQYVFVAPPYANFSSQSNCLGVVSPFTNFSLAGYGTITNTDWSFGDGGTSTAVDPSHLYTQPGQYGITLIVTNSVGCTDTTNQTISIFELPTAGFSFSANCTNNQRVVSFTDNSTSTDLINYWYYDFGGQGTVQTQHAAFTFPNPGTYDVSHIISTVNGCSDTINQQVLITPLPEAGFSYNFTSGVNVGTTFNFIDTSLYASSYQWNFGNGQTSTMQDPTTIYFQNGLFPVVQYVYDNLGCFDSTIVWVEIDNVTSEISTLIPNVISPNGDGMNDVWKLSFIELLYPNAIVEIYNEWGQQLFRSEGYTEPWDGRFQGEEVPDGNYFYVINLNEDIEKPVYKGALLVLRKKK